MEIPDPPLMVRLEREPNPESWNGIVECWGTEVFRHHFPHDRWTLEQMKEDTQQAFAARLRRALEGSVTPQVYG